MKKQCLDKMTDTVSVRDKGHPIELTSTEMIEQRINYIHENPVRTGIVAKAEEYCTVLHEITQA